MEQGHLVDPVEGVAGWAEPVRGLDPVEVVFALIVVPGFPIKEELPATA